MDCVEGLSPVQMIICLGFGHNNGPLLISITAKFSQLAALSALRLVHSNGLLPILPDQVQVLRLKS